MNQTMARRLRALPMIAALSTVIAVAAQAADSRPELRVCADPDDFPFSNNKLEGFENKIAEVVASELKAALRYTWSPERRGFIRQTLKAGLCDLVVGVPDGYDLVLTTRPYYRSTYVFVRPKDKDKGLRSFDDPVLRTRRIGVHAFGDDGANAPPVHALARRGIVGNIVGFTLLHTDESPPGRIVDAVADGEIDVAIVWGPYAGYFAKRAPVELAVTPVSPASDGPFLPFAYDIAMGVRIGDTKFKELLDGVLERRRDDIRKILEDYGVPLLDRAGEASRTDASESAKPLIEKERR